MVPGKGHNKVFGWFAPTLEAIKVFQRFYTPQKLTWVVVSNIFYFHPYLGKWSNLTNIFQMGWNRQLVTVWETIGMKTCRSWINPLQISLESPCFCFQRENKFIISSTFPWESVDLDSEWIWFHWVSIWVFPKIGVETPQIIHFNRVFHYKPSILGVFPLFLETPILGFEKMKKFACSPMGRRFLSHGSVTFSLHQLRVHVFLHESWGHLSSTTCAATTTTGQLLVFFSVEKGKGRDLFGVQWNKTEFVSKYLRVYA